jgi:hypothetical protein
MQRSPIEKTDTAEAPAAAGEAVPPATAKPEEKKEKKEKKFHNGWTHSLEILVAEWADKAACYRWMHERTASKFAGYNMAFTIPVIVFSTITGTANFGVNSLLPDQSYAKYASAAIGGVSLLTGLISTVANFLRYAQASEAHRVAGISWGKFQRFIGTELALHPNERMDAMSFLKMGRIELDRLIEQSPAIPQDVIAAFDREFKRKKDIKRPEIAGGIEHTKIFDDKDTRLARVASDAVMMLKQKKALMRDLVMNDIDKHIVQRTQAERDNMETELMGQVLKVAREAAREAARGGAPTVTNLDSSPPAVIPITAVAKEVAREAVARRPLSPHSVRLDIMEETGVRNAVISQYTPSASSTVATK